MDKPELINSWVLLGAYLQQHSEGKISTDTELDFLNNTHFESFEEIIQNEHYNNPWFTEKYTRKALSAISSSLIREEIVDWINGYPSLPVGNDECKTIGVVMAGNIPMVGFHDMISVIMSGNRFLGKLSSKDDRLMRKVAAIICDIEPGLSDRITFTEGFLKNIDALIATGNNTTSRYFEFYFRDIPHIIRKNRNGVAILSGYETREELISLGEDIFTYFGLGCRNVTKVFIPEKVKPDTLLHALESFSELSQHHKYNNNLEYNRSVYLMNLVPFLDNGVVLFKEDEKLASPVGVVYYEKYLQLEMVIEKITRQIGEIQCIVTSIGGIKNSIQPGESQSPKLKDYADGIDTMKFLTELKN